MKVKKNLYIKINDVKKNENFDVNENVVKKVYRIGNWIFINWSDIWITFLFGIWSVKGYGV